MRSGRLRTVLGATGLEHDDRLRFTYLACLLEEGARIADALDVEADDLGGRIGRDKVQEIELVDIDLVADIDALADREALARAAHDVQHDGAGEDAGLGEK